MTKVLPLNDMQRKKWGQLTVQGVVWMLGQAIARDPQRLSNLPDRYREGALVEVKFSLVGDAVKAITVEVEGFGRVWTDPAP